jgi:Ser/Thr protein kinase RdoA (MazF antagonist)
MLDVDTATAFLLAHGLVDVDAIIDGELTIASAARRNRNLRVQGPGGSGYLIKQPGDPTEGGFLTLRAEAAFYQFCWQEPAAAAMADLLPRLVYCDPPGAVLVLELFHDALPLGSYLAAHDPQQFPHEALRALGRALGLFHRTFRRPGLGGDPRLDWLHAQVPWVMLVHKPGPELLAIISQANYQTLRILQSQENLSGRLDGLRRRWRPEALIHNDIKSDNVLVRPGGNPAEPEVRLVDWELVQVGDPAWDLAGALQDLLLFWVNSMPLGVEHEQMIASARYPLPTLQRALRALWAGYRGAADRAEPDAADLLQRAVLFSAARLIQTAYEMAHGATSLPPASVLLLQIAANILADPERAQVQLYGIPGGVFI